MLRLPKTCSAEIRLAFEKAAESQDLSKTLPALTEGVRSLFRAQEALLIFDTEQNASGHCCFVSANWEPGAQFAAELEKLWKSRGGHEQLSRDLLHRLSAVSYSAFSWPFPRISLERNPLSGEKYAMPCDYSIFLPIASDMVVRGAEEPAFFGYIAVFFSAFPQISDEVVQLIISLPELLSQILSQQLRELDR